MLAFLNTTSLVSPLNAHICPSTIRWLVVSINIDSVDGTFPLRSFAIVSVFDCPLFESRIIVNPFVAYPYPAPAVIAVVMHVFVVAPRLHPKPNGIEPCPLVSVNLVLAARLSRPFTLQASAALGSSTPKVVACHYDLVSAIATTYPFCKTFSLRSFSQNQQAADSLSSHVDCLTHRYLLTRWTSNHHICLFNWCFIDSLYRRNHLFRHASHVRW